MAQRSNQDVAQLKKMRDQTNRIASANDEAVLKLSGAGLAVSFAIMRFLGGLSQWKSRACDAGRG